MCSVYTFTNFWFYTCKKSSTSSTNNFVCAVGSSDLERTNNIAIVVSNCVQICVFCVILYVFTCFLCLMFEEASYVLVFVNSYGRFPNPEYPKMPWSG